MSQQDSDPSRPGPLPLRDPATPRNSPSSSPASAAPSSTLVPSSLSQPPSDTESQNGLHRISYGQMLKAIWKETHYTCVLLPFIPVGIALHFINVSPVVVFVINFFAIVPLAALISFGTEEIAMKSNDVIGAILNVTFGNAVELIVGVIALVKGQIVIVQTSLLGSVLSNLLLVLGTCFLVGGIKYHDLDFNALGAQTATSLLALAISSLLIPAAFNASVGSTQTNDAVLPISRGAAFIILFVYAIFLYFQMKTHPEAFKSKEELEKELHKEKLKKQREKEQREKERQEGGHGGEAESPTAPPPSPTQTTERQVEVTQTQDSQSTWKEEQPVASGSPTGRHATTRKTSGSGTKQEPARHGSPDDDEEGDKEGICPLWLAIVLLLVSATLVSINAEFLVESIDGLVSGTGVSETFVGLILLPIVGNAAEHVSGITFALKNKMDLAINIAIGSSQQIALCVTPLMVIIGWAANKDMTLFFNTFETAILFIAILVVNYLIADGQSNYLEGVLLIALYLIISVAVWFYPTAASGAGAAASTVSAAVSATASA